MKPILFNTEMVKAILEGRKTVTRRVVKFKQGQNPAWSGYIPDGTVLYGSNNIPAAKAPYQPGDILWVREAWQFIPCIDCRLREHGACSDIPVTYDDGDSIGEGCFVYREDYPEPERINWRPSIHMPREASRIFLRVTGVRAERLQKITPEQIDAEGCKEFGYSLATGELLPSSPVWFRIVWDNTIKPENLAAYGWDANPWVWVIEFEQTSGEGAVNDQGNAGAAQADGGAGSAPLPGLRV